MFNSTGKGKNSVQVIKLRPDVAAGAIPSLMIYDYSSIEHTPDP